VRAAVDRLIATAPGSAPSVCLHGDVHLKNAIVRDGDVALIDLDQVATGPAAADVGSLLAALRAAGVDGESSVLAGYGRTAPHPLDRDALRWHVAAALVAERALRAITRVRADSLKQLPRLIAEASA
jgi:aminoglycoside phosphotransferase (APT) family kinase protein